MQRNFIVTTTRSGLTLITPGPIREPNREFAGSLKSRRKALRMAATYAEFAKDQPIYQCRAAGRGVHAYQLAVADYLEKPTILDINLRGWGRGVGEEIRIRAKDNFVVLRVRLVILNEEAGGYERPLAERLEQLLQAHAHSAAKFQGCGLLAGGVGDWRIYGAG